MTTRALTPHEFFRRAAIASVLIAGGAACWWLRACAITAPALDAAAAVADAGGAPADPANTEVALQTSQPAAAMRSPVARIQVEGVPAGVYRAECDGRSNPEPLPHPITVAPGRCTVVALPRAPAAVDAH